MHLFKSTLAQKRREGERKRDRKISGSTNCLLKSSESPVSPCTFYTSFLYQGYLRPLSLRWVKHSRSACIETETSSLSCSFLMLKVAKMTATSYFPLVARSCQDSHCLKPRTNLDSRSNRPSLLAGGKLSINFNIMFLLTLSGLYIMYLDHVHSS